MMEFKYNEASQLRVCLAILESQLKVANNKFKHLERLNKDQTAHPFTINKQK